MRRHAYRDKMRDQFIPYKADVVVCGRKGFSFSIKKNMQNPRDLNKFGATLEKNVFFMAYALCCL